MTLTAPPDTAEWLTWRRSGIGASDIAGILGISPWASPFTVWADKTGLLPADDDVDDDDPRTFGHYAEAMIAPWFTDRTGLHVVGSQIWVTHKTEPWIRATPDGVVVEDPDHGLDQALGGLEAKTDFGKPWDLIPFHYQSQGQWQMAATGWERVWFAVLHGRRFRTYVLERDDADITFMVDRARAFWENHVLTGIPPEIDGSNATAAAVAALYPTAAKGETVDIDHVAGAFRMLAEAKAEAQAAEAKQTAAHTTIAWALGNAETGLVNGETACTYKTQTRKATCRHCGATDESAPFRVLRPTKDHS